MNHLRFLRYADEVARAGCPVELLAGPPVMGRWDRLRLEQVVANLLSNAIKFSPAAGTVRVAAVEQQHEVLFTVSDEGTGIPTDQLEAIFGKFAQLDGSDARIQQGSGLGLAISRGIVEQHGGRIWAVSGEGLGATLCFTLPRVDAAVGDPAPYGGHAAPMVLVCEDDPHTRAVMCELLVAHGYRVVGAESAEQALTLASETVPDAVLMDLSLPGMDGWSAIATLRSWESTRHVPVLIVSGTEPGSVPADVEAWLTKPLDLSRLVSTVTQAIAAGAARSHVLVVEDDHVNQTIVCSMLHQAGYRTSVAFDGASALQLLERQRFDLVLMDIQMPVLDGLEATRLLRAAGYARPIVALTANVMASDVQQYRKAGCDDVLAKPIERERFFAVIAERLAADAPLRAPAHDAAFEATLDTLRTGFRAGLPEQADALCHALAAADWPRLRTLLHTLKGTAGSHGFPELTELAGKAEAELKAGRHGRAAHLAEGLMAEMRGNGMVVG